MTPGDWEIPVTIFFEASFAKVLRCKGVGVLVKPGMTPGEEGCRIQGFGCCAWC